MRDQVTLNNFKIAGTRFDRRRKVSPEDVKYIRYLYTHKKELKLRAEDIADMYDICSSQVYRYMNYDNYLAQCNKDSKNYARKNKDSDKFKLKKSNCYRSIVAYKNAILDVIDEYKNN